MTKNIQDDPTAAADRVSHREPECLVQPERKPVIEQISFPQAEAEAEYFRNQEKAIVAAIDSLKDGDDCNPLCEMIARYFSSDDKYGHWWDCVSAMADGAAEPSDPFTMKHAKMIEYLYEKGWVEDIPRDPNTPSYWVEDEIGPAMDVPLTDADVIAEVTKIRWAHISHGDMLRQLAELAERTRNRHAIQELMAFVGSEDDGWTPETRVPMDELLRAAEEAATESDLNDRNLREGGYGHLITTGAGLPLFPEKGDDAKL